MTGKYGGTEDSVTVSAELEAQLVAMLPRAHKGMTHNDAVDVEFYPCVDGVVALIGVNDGLLAKSHIPLLFVAGQMHHTHIPWQVDLKVICDGGTPDSKDAFGKAAELFAAL